MSYVPSTKYKGTRRRRLFPSIECRFHLLQSTSCDPDDPAGQSMEDSALAQSMPNTGLMRVLSSFKSSSFGGKKLWFYLNILLKSQFFFLTNTLLKSYKIPKIQTLTRAV